MKEVKQNAIFSGAGDGTRTRDNLLGSSSERFSAFYAQSTFKIRS